MSNVILRWMVRQDLPEVLHIEESCFEWMAWTEEDFLNALRRRTCIGMVAEVGEYRLDCGRVAGYFVFELFKRKIHLLNIAVHPVWQRQGVGSMILTSPGSGGGLTGTRGLLRRLKEDHRTKITVDVSDDNLPAQKFFAKNGFVCTGIEKSEETGIPDSYHMEYQLKDELIRRAMREEM